jgi:Protein of unknown function (DUF1059)
MAKMVSCKDAGVDCDFVMRGETAEDVLQQGLNRVLAHKKPLGDFAGCSGLGQSVQDKLGARRRTQAVQLGKEFGLLP